MRRLALAAALAALIVAPPSPRADGQAKTLKEAATAIAALHRKADALAPSDPRAAAEALAEGLKLALPPGEPSSALRADLFARIAQLRLACGDAKAALQSARAGLAEASGRTDGLTAQLRLREGEALEALGQDDEALEAYGQVIALGKKALEELRARRRGP